MPDTKLLAVIAERVGGVRRAVVGHDPLQPDTLAAVVFHGARRSEVAGNLVWGELRNGHAREASSMAMHEVPAEASIALAFASGLHGSAAQ
jgi:hypothetical protein